MDNYQTIQIEDQKNQLTIWLNRPELHNAMNDLMISELTSIFTSSIVNNNTRLVILRGKGKSFCAGADLNYMKSIATYGYEENVKDGKKLAALFKSIYDCPVPTIAVVHGAAFGGANGLLSACDIVIAEEETTFAFSEVKLGITPATISPFVIRRIGEFGAKELMMTGKRFKGEEALKWQLVNHITTASELDEKLDKIVRQIMSSAPEAVKQTKQLIVEVLDKDHQEMTELTAQKIADRRASGEGQEGMAAFLEKRKPKWSE